MIGFDLVTFGACLGFLGSLIMAKSFLKPSYQDKLVKTYWNQNPYAMRQQIIQRVEASTGTFWLVLGFLLATVGNVITVSQDAKCNFTDCASHFGVFLAFTAMLFWSSLYYAASKSKKEYLPLMVFLQRDAYQMCTIYIAAGGAHPSEAGQDVKQEVREQRLSDTRRNLDQIGELVDVPRKPLESDKDYAKRMEPLFTGS
jgi:drug/metabolite transporter (DMT)-like permease